MPTELDIYRSAALLIAQHGVEAPIQAALKADEMLAAGDLDGQKTWKRILAAVDELLSEKRPDGAATN